jgi:hypothetical protein
MQLIFIVIEYKISHFFAVIQLIDSLIIHFLGIYIGQVFCLGIFFGSNVPICHSNKLWQTKYVLSTFLIMQLIFIVIEYKISHFFAVIQFNRLINHYLGIGQVFCLETFFGIVMYLYVIQINCDKPSSLLSTWVPQSEIILSHGLYAELCARSGIFL